MEKHLVSYENALTDNEILKYATIIDKYKKEEINYKTLKTFFFNEGIEIQPNNIQYESTLKKAELQGKRIRNYDYLYTDVDGFILVYPNCKFNVLFRIDSKAIEVLANAGNTEYKESLISILKKRVKYSYDTDLGMAVERAKWIRRIKELENELEKKTTLKKTK